MNTEFVALAGYFQERVEGTKGSEPSGPPHLHAPALGESEVVARLGLHRFEQFVFALVEIEHDGACGLQASRRAEAECGHLRVYGCLEIAVSDVYVRLDLEEDSTALASFAVHGLPELVPDLLG